MTTRKGEHGELIISAMHKGYLVSRIYYGYTKRAALALFANELKTIR